VRATEQWNGLRNGYQEPRRLGADRWAALVGARQAVEGDACVVDCGTAVTVDALRADGSFLGGAICAGLALTREALAARTAGLRIPVSAARDALARSPEDAIAGGTLHGAAGAVDRLIDEVCGVLGPTPSVLVTGGDADVLVPLLRHPCRYLPDLVLRGVATLAGSAP
jgi:type III pantothenate kinase